MKHHHSKIGIECLIPGGAMYGGSGAIPIAINKLISLGTDHFYYIFTTQAIRNAFESATNARIIICRYSEYAMGRLLWALLLMPVISIFIGLDGTLSFNTIGIPLPGSKLIAFVAGIQRMALPSQAKWLERKLITLLQKTSLYRSSLLIVPSLNTKTDLLRRFPLDPQKIRVIYFAPRIGQAVASAAMPTDTQNRFKQFVLCVGTHPQKNLVSMIESFERLDPALKTTTSLVIAGPISNDARLLIDRVRRKNLRNVFFLGPISDHELSQLYRSATVFAMISLYETFGYPVLEAMLYGTPVLCSRGTSLEEIASDAAVTVDPKNISEISSALTELLKNGGLRDSLSRKGFERVRHFSWDRAASELYSTIRAL